MYLKTIPTCATTPDYALCVTGTGGTDMLIQKKAWPTGGSGELMWSDTTRSSTDPNTLATRYYADSVSLNVNHLYFDTIPDIPPRKDGTFYYDSTYKTVALMTGKDITLQLGQEEHIFGRASVAITNGQVVYINGTSGIYPTFGLADADAEATSFVVGVATQNIPLDSLGFVTVRGVVNDVNTNSYNVGDELFLAHTAGNDTNAAPGISTYKVRIGRVLTKSITGKIYVRQIPFTRVSSLSDVSLSSTAVNDALVWDGTKWVNRSIATVSAGAGVNFYPNARVIIANTSGTTGQNSWGIETMLKTPLDSAERVDAINVTAANTPLIAGAYLYNTALGRTSIDAGAWNFDFYASVSSVGGGRVSSITKNIYRVRPNSLSTVTITGTGTSRKCKSSANTGKPFAADSVTPSATRTTCSFVQTPKGLYQITAHNNDTSVTILVPTTYTNESAVAFSTWKKMFGNSTGTITALTTNYALYSTTSIQPAFTFETKDKIGKVIFGVSNNTTTVNYVYQGTERYSHIVTPLAVLHDNLAGLNAADYQHLTQAQKAIVDTTTAKTGLATNYDLTSKANLASPTFTGTIGGVDIDITGNITADSTILPGIQAATAAGATDTIWLPRGNTITFARTASTTITLKGGVSGGTYTIVFTHENSSTVYTVAFSPAVLWAGGTALTFTNTANAVDIVVLKLVGSTYYASGSADFKAP